MTTGLGTHASSGSGLIDARGQPLTKATERSGDSLGGMQWFQPTTLFNRPKSGHLKGAVANPRQNDWQLYLSMYKQHPIVHAAINKKVSVATNTGYDFVPRGRLTAEVPEDQAAIAQAFFEGQPAFQSELRKIYLDLELMGDAFVYVVPDRRRKPKRLKRLQPWTVHIKAKKNGDVEFYVQVVDNEVVVYRPHEILHIKHNNPDDDLYGQSRLEPIKQVVTSDLLAENYNLNFFKNGASTGTMILVKNASEHELQMNAEWIRNEYVGTEHAWKPIVLAGDIDVKNAVASHQEMGFLEGRKENQKAILAALDVPPAKIGDMESANRSNSKEQDKSFRTEAVMPLQFIVEDGLSNFIRDVLGCPDVLFKHSEGDIRDAQEQMTLWKSAAGMGFMTINEVRSKMGMVPIEGGDIAIVMTPTGAVPVADLELYFKLPQYNMEQYPLDLRTKNPPDPAYGVVGPAPNPKDSDMATVQGMPPATKSLDSPGITLDGLQQLVTDARTDDQALRHAYAHFTDIADETNHPLFADTAKNLKKALKHRDDDDLRTAYVDRVDTSLTTILQQLGQAHDASNE